MYKAIIVDDEPLARLRMQNLLDDIATVQVVAQASNGVEAVRLGKQLRPDIIFMDIQMPRMSGLDAALAISELESPTPAVIFCTAFNEFALQAFQASAANYLLKPVSRDDLVTAISRIDRISKPQFQLLQAVVDKTIGAQNVAQLLTTRLGDEFRKTPLSEVLYFKSSDKLVFACLVNGNQVVVDMSLKKLLIHFPDDLIQIHRNSIANKRHITVLKKNDRGQDVLKFQTPGEELIVSRRQIAGVRQMFRSKKKGG